MRNTRQKRLIFNIVNNSKTHPTVKDVYCLAMNVIPKISLGTVYRNLNLLVNENKIIRIKTSDGIDRYDRINNDHIHLSCVKCGQIVDIFDYKVDEEILIKYRITNYNIMLFG